MADKDCNEAIEEKNTALHPFERNKFFYGKLMSVRDFELEQSYFNGKRHLLSRLVHGVGLVCGLTVINLKMEDNILKVDLAPGVAIDCCGREIIVDKDYKAQEVKGTFDDAKLNYLYLKQKPCLKDAVPSLSNASTCEQECCYSRIKEDFELELSQEPPQGAEGTDGSSDAQEYYEKRLTKCPICNCDDPKVLLLVIKKNGTPDVNETRELRSIVYNNPMLYDLLSNHVSADNPHGITAETVKALMRINGVGNPDAPGADWVPEITLKGEHAIQVRPPDQPQLQEANTIIIDENHSERSDNPHGITAEQIGALKSINGVEGNPQGNLDLIPENKIAIEQGQGQSIIIRDTHTPNSDVDPTDQDNVRTKHVSNEDASRWNRGIRHVDVSSDGVTWEIVDSKEDGRINILGKGDIHVTRDGAHRIAISSTGGDGGARCLTGVFIFKNVAENKLYTSPRVGLPSAKAFGGIILGVEERTELGLSVVIGDELREWGIMLTASQLPTSNGFAMSILLRSRESRESLRVRWWAVMPTEALEDINVGRTRLIPEEVVVGIVAMNPGITSGGIRETYSIPPSQFNTVVESLITKKVIKRVRGTTGDNSRFTVNIR